MGIPPSSGEASNIVYFLRSFGPGRSVPTTLVARSVGREPEEIQDSLKALAEKSVLTVKHDGDREFVVLNR